MPYRDLQFIPRKYQEPTVLLWKARLASEKLLLMWLSVWQEAAE